MDIKIRGKVRRFELSYNILLPCLLAGILLVSLALNQISHFFFKKENVTNTVSVQLPVDHTVVTIPTEIRQFKPFEVSLQFVTKRLANRINDMVSTASEGTTIQGIVGVVASDMEAEVSSASFQIENQGPQPQLFMVNDETRWTWRILAEESGRQALQFRLHLVTRNDGQENKRVVDIAQASLFVQPSSSTWLNKNWGWIALFLFFPIAVWRLRHFLMR